MVLIMHSACHRPLHKTYKPYKRHNLNYAMKFPINWYLNTKLISGEYHKGNNRIFTKNRPLKHVGIICIVKQYKLQTMMDACFGFELKNAPTYCVWFQNCYQKAYSQALETKQRFTSKHHTIQPILRVLHWCRTHPKTHTISRYGS